MKRRRFDDGRCKHSGMQWMSATCALGIDVRAHVGGADLGWMLRKPCCVIEGFSRNVVQCANFVEYTEEEKVARDADMERAVESVLAGKSPCCGASLLINGTARHCETCRKFVARFCGEEDMAL